MQGTVKYFNSSKGYGFILPDEGGNEVFIHQSELQRASIRSLQEGDRIEYELIRNPKSSRRSAGKLKLLPPISHELPPQRDSAFIYLVPSRLTATYVRHWAIQNNVPRIVGPPHGYFHVTLLRSGRSRSVDLKVFSPELVISPRLITVMAHGTDGLMLHIDHPFFVRRHIRLAQQFGQRQDPNYSAHLTVSYHCPEVDIRKMTRPTFSLAFVREDISSLKEDE